MTDGTVYIGRVSDYTVDLDIADREIVLVPPLFSKTADKSLTPVPGEWQRAVVNGNAVQSMFVQYRPKPEGEN